MTYYITHIKDSLNQNYLGINISNGLVQPYLNEMKEILGEEEYNTFVENQQNRDKGDYHITVINVADYNKLVKEVGMDKFINSLNNIFSYEIDDLKFLGLGSATRNENKAYFIVCNSEKLEAVRKRYDLEPIDFHTTLGFKWKDVFGVRKNEVLKKSDKFLKLLANEFYKKDNWNFVKSIENYDGDMKSEVIPVKITDTYLKVKVDGNFMDINWLDNKFWIATNYSANQDLPRLPETEIARILKNN